MQNIDRKENISESKDFAIFTNKITIKKKNNMTNETRIILNDYEKYKEIYTNRNRAGLAPQTLALAFCMNAAGIEKLETREDIHELIVRMGILFKPMKIAETILIRKYIFYLKLPGRNVFLIPEDLKNHIGMQLTNTHTEQLTHEEWLQKQGAIRLSMNIKDAMMTFIIMSQVTWRIMTNDEDRQGIKWYYPRPGKLTMELNNARILADTITEEIDEKHFEHYREFTNNESETNGEPDKPIKTELPIQNSVRKNTNETNNKTAESPTAKKRNEKLPGYITKFMIKGNSIPWPFAEGTILQRENNKTDPQWN